MTWSDFFVDVEGRRVAVRDYGGKGPALVLLHGGGGNVAGFDTLAPQLVPELSVIAYDAAGHGASDEAALVGSRMTDDLYALVARLAIERPVLVGSSMGGAVAQRYAAAGHPCAGVVAIDGAFVMTREEAEAWQANSRDESDRRARDGGWGFLGTREEAEEWVAETSAGESPPFESHLRRSLQPAADGLLEQRPTLDFVYAMHLSTPEMPIEYRTIEIYERISTPLLLLNAERGVTPGGPYTDEQRARLNALPERHQNIEVRWIDSGHLIHWEHPKLVANLVREFVSRVRAAS